MKPDKKKTRISLIEDIRDYIRDISMSERSMLNTLASFANPDGSSVYPGQKRLMIILGIKERRISELFASLEEKGYVTLDGKRGYTNKYRLNIPTMPVISQDISKEEWEKMMLPPDDDDDATEMRMPVVKPPPAPPPETPAPGRSKLSPEEALEGAAKLVRIGLRDYEWYLKGGRKKGYTDEYLDWIFKGGGETGSGSQPYEPESATTNISEGTH